MQPITSPKKAPANPAAKFLFDGEIKKIIKKDSLELTLNENYGLWIVEDYAYVGKDLVGLRKYILNQDEATRSKASLFARFVGLRGTNIIRATSMLESGAREALGTQQLESLIRDFNVTAKVRVSLLDCAYCLPEHMFTGTVSGDNKLSIASNPIVLAAEVVSKEEYEKAVRAWCKMVKLDKKVDQIVEMRLRQSGDYKSYFSLCEIVSMHKNEILSAFKDI